ncbi:MAG: HAD family hydrolase [Chthoniobacterales bacterium]|nr:HAD family hydrolase [Chthoniobacterales bacterium]
MKKTPFQVLIFDLDDTLLVDEAVSREALEIVLAPIAAAYHLEKEKLIEIVAAKALQLWKEGPCYSFCRSIGISAMECLWGNFLGESAELQALRSWALSFRQEVFQQSLLPYEPYKKSLAELSVQLARCFEQARRACQRLFPQADSLIENLSHRYQLGLLTNGAPDLQREKIKASGLESFFSAIVISGEHGIGKPDPAVFHRLLEQLKATPAQALMIGNSLERDIAGAHAAGVRSVWIDLGADKEKSDVQPDFRITELVQLPFLDCLL